MIYVFIALIAIALIFFLKKTLKDSFKAVSFDLMEKNSKSFFEMAKSFMGQYQENLQGHNEHLLKPLKEELTKIEAQTRELERRRENAYATLSQQVTSLLEMERALKTETGNLAKALRSPNVRGSWGQVHLRRVVELAGLSPHADFNEQKTFESEGRIQRPDLIVHLPGERLLVVDSKVPMDAYLDASETKDEAVRAQKWKDHANALKSQIRNLSLKEYWKQFPKTPEFVILFLPAEAFFSAALEADSSLIDMGAGQNILMATPTTLIAILRSVASIWKQEKLSKNAEEIALLGKELYERLNVFVDHFSKVGKSLNSSVEHFNNTISSLETRVLVTARKLKDAGASMSQEEIKMIEPVDTVAREK
ncbi:MAG TPA: DNA recombination protein RmuC [Chlamydiales bacterium]|nr:DNA recombination protein RmuC [Chlamydiales bacterium]